MDAHINIEFTASEVNAVLLSLGKQPYAEVAGLIDRISAQCSSVLTTQTSEDDGPELPAASELAE